MKIFSIIIVTALTVVLAPSSVMGQTAKSTLPGNALMTHNGQYAALAVDGTTVLNYDAGFVDFKTDNGVYFAAQKADGSFRLIDRKGKTVELGGQSVFYKLSLISGTVVAQTGKESAAKYYSTKNLSVEIKPQAADGNHFEKELEKKGGFSPKLAGQRKDVEVMEKALSEVDPIGRFELQTNAKGSLDLMVDGKVLFSSSRFSLISDAAEYKKSNCWFFIVSRGDYSPRYGVYAISMFIEDGKKVVQNSLMIPYEYPFIEHEGGNMIKCSTLSGAPVYFNWWGWRFDRDWKTGTYTPMYMKWTHDESTNKWSLQKKEEK